MNKKVPLILAALTVIANVAFSPLDAGAEAAKNVSRLDNLEPSWSEADDYGRQWSAEWEGLIVAPATGRITFAAETDQALQIKIAGETAIESKKGTLAGSVSMVEAKQYPIEITYVKGGQSYDCYFKIQWSWSGQKAVSISAASLFHTDQQEQQWLDKARQVEDEEDDDDDEDDGDGASLLEQPSHLWQASDAASAGTPGLVGLICENPRFK
ncbi:MAG: PA14 domain-containing protein, partial [Planctomycetota bacterium]